MTIPSVEAYKGWALVEQMGFRKTVGLVSEVEQYGTKMLRLDIPVFEKGEDGKAMPTSFVTRFCGGPSLYQVTPLDEEVGLIEAQRQSDPRPVHPTTYQHQQITFGDTVDDDAPF